MAVIVNGKPVVYVQANSTTWVSGFTTVSTSGDIAILKGDGGQVIADGGILAANLVLTGDSRLSNARTPTAHASTHESGGSDAIAIDLLAAASNNTNLNASTAAHGLLKILNNTATNYMDGTGNWSTPAPPGRLTNISVLTGNGNFTTQATTTHIHVKMLGAGGGSGGAKYATGNPMTLPGGPGAYLEAYLAVVGSTAYAYVVGAGGLGGTAAPGNGGTGGNSTLIVGATTYTAGGGPGSGANSTSATPAGWYEAGFSPGVATNGNILNLTTAANLSDNGSPGYMVWMDVYTAGVAFYGGHLPPGPLSNSQFGAGGCPCMGNSGGVAGNAGLNGTIIIEEYT